MAAVWRGYMRLLKTHPFKTQATTTAVLMGGGDFLAQIAVERRTIGHNYEPRRTLKYFGVGLLFAGPILSRWYFALDKMFRASNTHVAVVKRVMMDQGLLAPAFILSFITIVGVVRPDPWDEIKYKINRDYKEIMITNYKVWPAVQLLNFYFVPLHHRVLVVNLVSLLWNTYIAWKAEKATVTIQPEILQAE